MYRNRAPSVPYNFHSTFHSDMQNPTIQTVQATGKEMAKYLNYEYRIERNGKCKSDIEHCLSSSLE